VATPSHAVAGGLPRVVLVRRVAYWILAFDFVALGGLGVWLAFRYEPTSTGVSNIHSVLGVVALLAALVAAIATVADHDRPFSAVLPAIVVLAVVAGMYLTGPTLAWDRLVTDGPTAKQQGVTVVFDENVGFVAQGEKSMTAQTYRRYAWLHALALPVGLSVMGGAGMWAARRRRAYKPQRVAEPDIDLTD
jgi:quinol-cytochrome oxidoreductase complex cytochrome b subunit